MLYSGLLLRETRHCTYAPFSALLSLPIYRVKALSYSETKSLAGTDPNLQEFNNISLDCIYVCIVDTFFLDHVSWRLTGPVA